MRKSLAFIMMLMVTLCAFAKGSNYKRIAEEAEIVNKACPIKLDDYIKKDISEIKHQHIPKAKGISEYLDRLSKELKDGKPWIQI